VADWGASQSLSSPYRDSQTGKDTAITLDPLDWLSRFLQHILPPYFARVRTFGWLHPAAKVRGNRVRALLGQPPVLSPAQQQAWHLPREAEPFTRTDDDPQLDGPDDEPANAADTSEVPARSGAPLCPHCRKVMRRVESWRPGQPMSYATRHQKPSTRFVPRLRPGDAPDRHAGPVTAGAG